MTPPPLEDRLSRLADDIDAPPTADARAAIGGRTRVLRRRRRAMAAGAGVLAATALVGLVAVVRGDSPDDGTIIADTTVPQDTTVPDAPTTVPPDTSVPPDTTSVSEDDTSSTTVGEPGRSEQRFQVPGDPDGRSVVLRHESASDAVAALPGEQNEWVTVADVRGLLVDDGSGSIILRWGPMGSDSHATIEATGLTRDEVVAFADGLDIRDDDIGYPPTPEDEFGFDLVEPILGLVEVPAA